MAVGNWAERKLGERPRVAKEMNVAKHVKEAANQIGGMHKYDAPKNPDVKKASDAAFKASSDAMAHKGGASSKAMGEDFLAAAKAHSAAASTAKTNGASGIAAAHNSTAGVLRSAAEQHAKDAGSSWDEGKHPRDKNGKFT